MISNKILTIPDYEDVQEKIKIILEESLLVSSKILLSDLAFKAKEFTQSYNLLKNNFQDPRQLLDFAYHNKKIYYFDGAILSLIGLRIISKTISSYFVGVSLTIFSKA